MKVSEQDHPAGLYDRIVLAIAAIAIAMGVLVLIGWLLEADALKSILPGLTAMKANAAVGFILSGVALGGIQTTRPDSPWRVAAQICAGGVLLGGLLALVEHLSGLDLGIDQLLIPDVTNLPGDIPGRVAIDTAISFTALGAALLLASLERESLILAANTLLLLPLVLGGASLIGYGYDIEEFLRARLNYTPMSLPAALLFVLLALGVACARPHYPFRRLIASDTDAGRTVRRLLPMVVFFTLLLGWSIHYAYQAGLINEAMVPALFSAATIAWACVVILVHGGQLYHAGLQRDRSYMMADDNQAALRTIIDMLPIGLWILDEKVKATFSNEEAGRMWGGVKYLDMEHLNKFKAWRTENGTQVGVHEWPGVRAIEKGETTTEEEVEIEAFDGRRKIILYSASPLRRPDGTIRGAIAIAQDITERKRAEERRSYLAAIVESSDDAIIGKTLDGVITSWNKGAERMYGYTAEEAIGQPVSILIPPGHEDELPHMLKEVKSGVQVEHYETTRRRKDGSPIHVSLSLSPIVGIDGNIVGAATIAREITRIRKAEEQLRTASIYVRSLIEANLDPLVTISPEGLITDVNEATIQATGVPRDELIGSDFSEYFTDPELARAGYQEAFARGYVRDYPLSLRHIDGSVMEVLYNASVYRDDNGKVTGVFAAARDITERRKAEEERIAASAYARSLIEASLDPLVTISAEGKITDVNEATVQATGVPRETLVGSDFSEYFTDPDLARAGYREVFAKGFVTDYPLTLRHVSGKTTEVLYNASLYWNVKGQVAGVFASARDITERKKAEKALHSASLYARSLIEANLDPLVTISPEGFITDVNEATVKATGMSRETLIGSDFSEYFTEPTKARTGYQQAFAKGYVTDYPLTLRHASGKVMEVLYNASVYRNDKGEVAGVFAAARDITERKQAESALHAASMYARSLIEANLDPLVTISPDGLITDVNEATVEATGMSRRELIGSDFSVYFTEPDKARAGYQAVFAKGFVKNYPLTLRHSSGTAMDVLYNASVYRNEKGEVVGAFAAARDITERKKAEQQRLAASIYARSLIEASLDPFVTISLDGKITDVNGATVKATGLKREMLIGSDFSDYFTEPEKARAGYQEAFAKGYVTDYPLTLRHVSGSIMEVLYNASVYRDEKGEVAGVFAAARDITGRRLAEAEINERMKELQALFRLSELAEEEATNLDKLYQKLTDLIPDSWKYSEVACARIIMGASEFRTKNFKVSQWMQAAPIKVHGAVTGRIEVGYLEKRPDHDEGPFIKEERLLINAIAERVGRITERKEADDELRAAALYARSLIEASLDPLVTISAKGKITDVNEATVQATGMPRKLLIGSDFSEYFTEPDKARAGYQEVFSKGFVLDYPLTLRHVSGRTREVLYNASVYRGDKGEVAGVFASARDITGRKHAEEELRTAMMYARSLIETNLDPMLTINAEGKITDVNEATVQIMGVPRKLLLGSNFSTYFTDPEKAHAGYQEAFSKGHVMNYPLAIRSVSGKVTEVLYNASIFRNDKGEVAGVLAVARDITESKQAEIELRRYHEQLEAQVKDRTAALESANKDLEGFAYSVSHDLRVPLRAVDGFSRLLLTRYENKLDDEGKRLLNVVRDNTKKMGQLIDDILAFSRMGRLAITMTEVDMVGLVRSVFDELKPTISGRDVALDVKPLPSCPGDQSMLSQVWVNLLGNAIKFTKHKESALIEVGGKAGQDEAVYYIKDNGAGFDMQYADKLFGVFQRLHGVEEFEGTGIGLAIVKRIVTRHGGRVWAEGKVNEGATFYFAIPI